MDASYISSRDINTRVRIILLKGIRRTSLVVQQLRLYTSTAGSMGSVKELRSHMPKKTVIREI